MKETLVAVVMLFFLFKMLLNNVNNILGSFVFFLTLEHETQILQPDTAREVDGGRERCIADPKSSVSISRVKSL